MAQPSRMYAPRRGRGFDRAGAVCSSCVRYVDTRNLRYTAREDIACCLCGAHALDLDIGEALCRS